MSDKIRPIGQATAESRKAQLDRIIATNVAKDLTAQDLVLGSMREAILTRRYLRDASASERVTSATADAVTARPADRRLAK